jgi:hypothetical protein
LRDGTLLRKERNGVGVDPVIGRRRCAEAIQTSRTAGFLDGVASLAMTDRHASTFSRRILRPSYPLGSPSSDRGRRECRELAAPMARLQQKTQAAVTTGSAETSRHSPRDGFNSCFAFSLVRRAFWPPLRMMLAHQRVIPASGYQDDAT